MSKLSPALPKTISLRWAVLLGLLVGVAFLPFRLTADYALGRTLMDDEAELHNGSDRLQVVTGAFYFAQDSWRLPLFQVDKYGPEGTNVVFTDSIPAAALALKLANQVHPVLFNYFGLWVALCFALNPLFFCWLLYELEVRDWRWLAAGAVLASCVPALLFRHGHACLCSHFLILWALALYFRAQRQGLTKRIMASYFGLILLSLLVTLYLLAMVMVIFIAAIAQACRERRLGWGRGAAYIGGSLALCLATMLLCGHITLTGGLPPPGAGFGANSMNLVSPVWPWLSAFAPNGKPVEATGGQYEGYNYLGAGVLVLLVVHALLSWRQILGLARQYWALAGAFVLFVILALSNKIYLWHYLLLQYHFAPYDHFMANFRSSGRFFWPVGYGVMAALIVLTVRRFAPRRAALLLAGAALLQAYDLHVLPRIGTNPQPAFATAENIAQWENILGRFPRVEIQPAFDAANGEQFNAFIQYVAARKNLPINSVYQGRPPANTDFEYEAADHPVIKPGVVYLFEKSDYPLVRLTTLLAGQKYVLAEADEGYLVASAWPPDFLAQTAAKLRPAPPAQFLAMTPQTVLDFTDHGDLTGVSFTGFYYSEYWGRWSRGPEAEIRVGLDPALRGHALVLRGDFIPWLDAANPAAEVGVEVNGQAVGSWTFAPPDGAAGKSVSRTLAIPATATLADTLTLRFLNRQPAHVFLTWGPERRLGLGFVRLKVEDGSVTP